MTTKQTAGGNGGTRPRAAGTAEGNTVTLRGTVSTGAEERELPSGTVIVTFRLSVPRAESPMTKGSRQTSDWVDCSAWGAGVRRRVAAWQVGDEVEVVGALRRRFYRGAGGTATRLEVEVLSARKVTPRRAARVTARGTVPG